jgi:putative transposase
VYLVAVIDWYSRKVLSWRLSNMLDSGFYVDGLEQGLQPIGTPEIFNIDQGCQFISEVLPAYSRRTVLPSALMGVAGHWIISSLNGYGAASNTKMCI